VQGEGGSALKPSGLISHFVGHVCLGALGFIVLAIPAILFSLAAHYLEQTPVSTMVIDVFLGLHYFLLAVDTAYFSAYIVVSVYDAVKELIRYAKGL
jgi:hypothetical protein